jgi:hypothetical protein
VHKITMDDGFTMEHLTQFIVLCTKLLDVHFDVGVDPSCGLYELSYPKHSFLINRIGQTFAPFKKHSLFCRCTWI